MAAILDSWALFLHVDILKVVKSFIHMLLLTHLVTQNVLIKTTPGPRAGAVGFIAL